MTRTQWILAVALLAQVGLLLAIAGSSSGAGAAAPHPLLPDLASVKAAKITIRDGADKSLTLERAGDAWTLADPAGYPADSSKVEDLLAKLGKLEVGRPIVTSARYHEQLEVADDKFERRVEVFPEGKDAPAADLLIGTSPSYGVEHVRAEGDDRVYEARGIRPYDVRAEAPAWIDRDLVGAPPGDVVAVTVRNGHGRFELRRENGAWSSPEAAGKKLDGNAVDGYVRSLASLAADAPAGPLEGGDFGLDRPAGEVEISWREPAPPPPPKPDGAKDDANEAPAPGPLHTVKLRVGKEVPGADGKRWVARDGARFAAVIGKWQADTVLAKTLADLEH